MNVKETAEVRAAVKFQNNNRAFGPGAMQRTPSPSDRRRYTQEKQHNREHNAPHFRARPIPSGGEGEPTHGLQRHARFPRGAMGV